jgi:hypothetical protein
LLSKLVENHGGAPRGGFVVMPDVFADTLAHCSKKTAAFVVEAATSTTTSFVRDGGESGGEDERD